ncbi:MAG: SMI1/KNR4 family protein [Myxococcota bacterium]
MNRWLRLPSGPHRSWRLHGVHAGIAWLTSHDYTDGVCTLHAWDLASGTERFTEGVGTMPPRVFLAGPVAVVSSGGPGDGVRAFSLDGPLWSLPGRCLGAGEHAVAVLHQGLVVVDPSGALVESHPDVEWPSSLAICGGTVRFLMSGEHRSIGAETRHPPAPPDATAVTATHTDFVFHTVRDEGASVRTLLTWQGREIEVDGTVTWVDGSARHLMVASDALDGLRLEVFDRHGSVACIHPDQPVQKGVSDEQCVLAAWPGAAAWFTSTLQAVRLPDVPDPPTGPPLPRGTGMLHHTAALWDGFPVLCSPSGGLVPLAPGSVSPAGAGDPPLVFEPLPPARPTVRLATAVDRCVRHLDTESLRRTATEWDHSEAHRQRYRSAGIHLEIDGYGPPFARDPHLLRFATDHADGAWCLYAHPAAAEPPVVRWSAADGDVQWIAPDLTTFLIVRLAGPEANVLRFAPRGGPPPDTGPPWWFTVLYGNAPPTPADPEPAPSAARAAALDERRLLRAFLAGEAGAGPALLRWYETAGWAYAHHNLAQIQGGVSEPAR